MAWSRDEARLPSSSFTAYAYTEADWSIGETACTYRHLGGVTSPYGFGAQASAELEWWEGSWHDYDPEVTGSGTFSGYGDLKLCETTDSFARAATDRTVSLGCSVSMMGASARAWIDYTVPHLAPVVHWAEDDPVVRNSDNSITLTWDAPALEYSAMCLEVSIDGGSWSQFAVLWNTATSYTWTECSADHSYQFRIRSNYLASYSAYEVCPTVVVNTPAAPAALKVAATSGTNVTVTLENPSTVATSTSYQLSADGQTWPGAEVTGQSTASFSVNMGANHYIRVKNVNATGSSAWIVSGYIQTVTKPNPPSISASMQTWDIASNLTVSWVGSYPDGSSQTAYKYRTRKNGGAWSETTVNPSTATSLTLTPAAAGVSVGDTFSVSVATKGAASSFSDYPAELVIQVAQKPTVIVTSPGDEVSTMPIEVRATFSDTGNTCEAARCTLKQGTAELYSEDMEIANGALSCDISEFLPDNGASYTLEVYAISSTGLSQTTVVPFATDFLEPVEGALSIVNDPETGYASLVATYDNGGALLWNQSFPAVTINVSRSGWSATSAADNRITVTATQTVSDANSNDFSLTGAFDTSHVYAFLCAGAQEVNVRLKSYGWTSPAIIWPASQGNKYTNVALAFSNLQPGEYTIAPVFVDLTAMYGAGNEPTSLDDPRIEQLRAFAEKHPEVSSGTIYMVAEAESISVTRVNPDGTQTTLIANAPSGSGIVDRFAPLNNGYKYAVTTTASTKAVKVVYVSNEIKTPRWFAYWGDNIAWARWNPKGGVTITRPEKKRVHYVGRTYPVSYDSLAIDQQNTLKVTALLDEWSDGFADLMRDGGRGVYKGADGSVFWADFEYSTSADYASATRIDEVSLTITRIDGEKL